MTAINFPNSPAVNDTYVVDGVTYTWDGVRWKAGVSISLQNITMATARILGRTTAGAGAVEELAVTGLLSLSGGNLQAQGAALSVAGVAGNATADLAAIVASTDHQVLRRSGTSVGFGAVNLAQAAAVTGILPSANGGTANAFFALSGPATSVKTYTLPNVSTTILTTNAAVTVAQGGTGLGTLTANNVVLGNGTSSPLFVAPSTSGNVLTSNGSTWTSAAPAAGMVYPGAGIAVSTGSAWGTSKTNPAGEIVGTTETQTLTNKTLTNQTVTNYTETRHTATGSTTINLANGTIQQITTNGNITITLPASVSGKSFVVIVAFGGAHTVTWAGGGTIKWLNGAAPAGTSVNGKFDIFTFFQDGTNTYASVFGQNF